MFIQKYFEKLTRNVDIVVQFNMREYIEWKSEKHTVGITNITAWKYSNYTNLRK